MIEKYYTRLTLDFHTNKRISDEVATIPTKRLRNKVAGYVTHLMKRISKGPVRGISIRLQEEERERRDNFVPEVCIRQLSSCRTFLAQLSLTLTVTTIPISTFTRFLRLILTRSRSILSHRKCWPKWASTRYLTSNKPHQHRSFAWADHKVSII